MSTLCWSLSWLSALPAPLGWTAGAAARCGLLHDLYPGEKSCPTGPFFFLRHAWNHPKQAAENARTLTYLTKKERNIIESHMWPMCKALPRSREAWLVNLVDSFVAVLDILGWNSMFCSLPPEQPSALW